MLGRSSSIATWINAASSASISVIKPIKRVHWSAIVCGKHCSFLGSWFSESLSFQCDAIVSVSNSKQHSAIERHVSPC
ncbi:unnamed protein product [Amoebophrya sp. A120]|nr:unnamed protein product [Amoebophrya sp. A120]|eukprot:GSA120T00017459001.1